MSEKLVLPRFDVPRDSTRIAMRTLWAMGGVVVLATLVLGLAMWHHRALEIATAEEAAAKAAAKVAAAKAALEPKPVVAVQVVKPADKAGASGPVGGAAATTLANVAPSAAGTETAAAPAPKLRRSAKSTSRSRSAARALALPDLSSSKSAKAPKAKGSQKSNDDVIDRLLNKYK